MDISCLRTLALNILKNGYPESIASSIEIPELEPCAICNEEIFLHLFKKSFTVLTCGHVFHRLCLENIRENTHICPGKNCVAEIEIVEKSPLVQTPSQRSMSIDGSQEKLFNPENDPSCLDTIAEEDSNDNRSQNKESDVPETSTTKSDVPETSTTSALPSKRANKTTTMDKPPSKKKKSSSREDSPVLKKLIDELSTDVSGTSEVINNAREDTSNTSNFLYLYSRIDQAESKNETTNQDVIRCYYCFGKALEDRFEHYKKTNPKRTAQALVNEEVRKQLPHTLSDALLRKKKERAQKIYDLFNGIGEDMIRRIKSFTALTISKLM
ncbi:13920_t:CDS:2 [Entrophospora sp. SA101]|nr:13920_t:CDS:2 [Entrophospora sp. SA101]